MFFVDSVSSWSLHSSYSLPCNQFRWQWKVSAIFVFKTKKRESKPNQARPNKSQERSWKQRRLFSWKTSFHVIQPSSKWLFPPSQKQHLKHLPVTWSLDKDWLKCNHYWAGFTDKKMRGQYLSPDFTNDLYYALKNMANSHHKSF